MYIADKQSLEGTTHESDEHIIKNLKYLVSSFLS